MKRIICFLGGLTGQNGFTGVRGLGLIDIVVGVVKEREDNIY